MKTFKELKEKLNEYYTVHIHDENDKPDFVGDPTKYSSSAVQKSLKHTQKGKTVTIKSKDHLGTVDSVVVKPGSYVKKYVDQLKTKRNEQTVKEDIELEEQHREVGRFHPTVPYNVPNVKTPKPRHSGSSLSTQYRNANKDSTRLKTHSLVKDLIKKRLNKPFGEETTEVSKKTKMIKDIAKNKNDKFQSEPIITDTLVKTASQ